MSAVLKRIDDPRDALDKARHIELVAFVRANGILDITPDMPAILIRRRLRAKGIRRIPIPERPLGVVTGQTITDTAPTGIESDAADDLERQFKATPKPVAQDKKLSQMSINELRAHGKKLGIKWSRRDNMITMREKIEAQQSGENAS